MDTPRFIQIAVAPHDDVHTPALVYALDVSGCVWWFNFLTRLWERLPNEAAG